MAWYNYNISHGYLPGYQGPGTDTPHYAVDLAAPFHTPFSFPDSGTIKQADYAVWSGQPGGGEVFLQPDSGGPEEYVYHLDQIAIKPGQHVQAFQPVGLSGGQNSGGEHNTSPMWSSGAHIHFGYFNQYVNTPAGSRPYGPDPTNLVNSLKASGGNQLASLSNMNLPFAASGQNCTAPSGFGWLDPTQVGQYLACQAGAGASSSLFGGVNWKEILIRAGIITAGVVIAGFGFYGLVQKKSIVNVQEMPPVKSVKNENPIAPPPPKVTT